MSFSIPVNPETFQAIQNVDIDQLSTLSDVALRPILPCLVRMSLCAPLDASEKWTDERRKILKCLSGIDVVNSLVALLSIDFHELEQDARKEQQLRGKQGGMQTESILIAQLEQGLALEFERSDAARKLRLLLSELLFIMSQMKDPPPGEFYHKPSELFESEVYLEEVSDVLCIAQAELPSLLPVADIAEALLHVDNGAQLTCRVVANVPDYFFEVCQSLIANGERQDEESVGGLRRAETLRMICEMCPSEALNVRAMCVSQCRMPSLTVALTLHHCHESLESESMSDGCGLHDDKTEEGLSDVVAFVSGLLLGSDLDVRNWFSQFIRIGQKRKDLSSMLPPLRQELLEQLIDVVPDRIGEVTERQVVQGCAFIRLYCALKCIAALRFNEEEIRVLVRLITCHPQPSAAGVRFVCLGLCMVLACPYLLGTPDQEKMAVDWIKWLVKESTHFERVCGAGASFGEMLLLIAIHFHSNQNNAIADLVSATLGMKSAVKANALSKLKAIFTQEIFTEKVVTSHAVKVSVTRRLNANIPGYLPVHCIYQLLNSRAFSKHKVPIKDWIVKQLRHCTIPIHPLIPNLIEAYINSIILPSNKTDRTNQPITEQEILAAFKDSELAQHFVRKPKLESSIKDDAMEVDAEGQSEGHGEGSKNSTSELLFVYYVLLYQDMLLNNMKNIVSTRRHVKPYSPELLAQLPVKVLLQEAQTRQKLYAGLFPSFLRLVATRFPDLCLVEDWLDESLQRYVPASATVKPPQLPCNQDNVRKALSDLSTNPTPALILLGQLAATPTKDLLQYIDILLARLPDLLRPDVPVKVRDLVKRIWFKLNAVTPRKLRVETVNALRCRQEGAFSVTAYRESDLIQDPLLVLRCDDRVFRCSQVLEIVIRILSAFLQMSRSHVSEHIQSHPLTDKSSQGQGQGQGTQAQDREELKDALMAAQDSAAVQILIECCLPLTDQEKTGNLLNNLREVQCLICSHLHQMFIADPNLVKLVHFQGYPSELLAVTVPGIPSMHICLDFIPELLGQPSTGQQIFAIELVSYLSLQYSLPKSMAVAKLAVNVMATLLGVLPSDTRPDFFLPTLPALQRISRAFPPLSDDIISFLMQLGRVCHSHIASVTNRRDIGDGECLGVCLDQLSTPGAGSMGPSPQDRVSPTDKAMTSLTKYTQLSGAIQRTFSELVRSTASLRHQLSS